MKQLLQTLFVFLFVTQICFGQWQDNPNVPNRINEDLPIILPHTTHTPGRAPVSLHPSFYDRKAEWQWIIDSTWGPGESLAGSLQLLIFTKILHELIIQLFSGTQLTGTH